MYREESKFKRKTWVFKNTISGDRPFPPLGVPVSITPEQLLVLVRALLKDQNDDDDDDEDQERPFLFFLDEEQIRETLEETFKRIYINKERTVPVIFKPQSLFR